MRFRSKPLVVEAVQWDGNLSTVEALARRSNLATTSPLTLDTRDRSLTIPTAYGAATAEIGDWLVLDPNVGSIYPRTPLHFADTFEAVEEGH